MSPSQPGKRQNLQSQPKNVKPQTEANSEGRFSYKGKSKNQRMAGGPTFSPKSTREIFEHRIPEEDERVGSAKEDSYELTQPRVG